MAVNPPDSGDTITKASITDMHASVRAEVNSLKADDFGVSALRHDQLPSLLLPNGAGGVICDVANNVADVTIDHNESGSVFGGETDWASSWVDLQHGGAAPDYFLNNGGSGYTLPKATTVIAWCSLRFKEWNVSAQENQVFFNLFYEFNGSRVYKETNNRFIRLDNVVLAHRKSKETIVTIAWAEDLAAGTLNKIGVRWVLNRGNGVTSAYTGTVANGSIGFIAVKKDA